MDLDDKNQVLEHVARLRVDGTRLDSYLVNVFGEYSRSAIKRVIDDGGVQVNGKLAKASYKVRHGDVIRVKPPESEYEGPKAEDIPLEVLFEDEWLAVINKPANMVVHPA